MTVTDSYSERSYLAGLTSNMDVRAHIGRSNPSPIVASSGQEWQYDISTVRAHIGRSTGISTPPVVASSGQEWQYDISTVRVHIGRSTGRSTPPSRAAKNGNFRFLL